MSTALIILLNKKIPDDIIEKYNNFEITSYLDNNNLIVYNETTMYISDASEILKKNSILGYNLDGYAYALEDGSGSLLYKDFKNAPLTLTDVQVNYRKERNKWIFNIVKNLIENDYSVKIFDGNFQLTDIPEEPLDCSNLSLELLKNIYTVIEENILYTIYDITD